MRDLKHIHFYEDLLEQANNELVQKAKKEGKACVAYTCYYMPEALLNLDNSFSVRLRAPHTGSLDISQYYMSSFICGYSRALLERAFEGGFNFVDCYFSSDTCQQMVRVVENIHEMNLIDNKRFYYNIIDAPLKITEHGTEFYTNQVKTRFLEPLRDKFNCDISEEALRKAVEMHNRMCAIFEEISEMRKEENPKITQREFHILCLVSYACPTYLILPYLEETLEDLRHRQKDEKNRWRARVVVVGSEIDDYTFSEILESCNCYVVADRYCYGSIPGRQQIVLNDKEPVLDQVCRNYLVTNQCPRFMAQDKIQGRRELIKRLVEDYKADGIIYEQAKFCDFWGYERMLASRVLQDEYHIPTTQIDREYVVSGSGQLMTRIQAFVESLEIKKIQAKEAAKHGKD